jgi:hypothetical protein
MEEADGFRKNTRLKASRDLVSDQGRAFRKRTMQLLLIPRTETDHRLSARDLETILVLAKTKESLFNGEQIPAQVGLATEEMPHQLRI